MIFLLAVLAAIDFVLRIGKNENVIQFLLDRSDTSRIFAADYICDLFREAERFFIYNLRVFNNIDSDVMVNESEDIKIHEVNRAFDFHNRCV